MGNSSSQEDDEFDKFDGIETLGYRVLGVQPDSPASKAGLVSFFDFLVGVNDKMLLGSGEDLQEGEEYDDIDLPALLRDNLEKDVELLVYNIKSQETRLVTLVPSNTWGGAGLLGVTIRLDNYGGADERVIRVLSVEHNSPAAIAGLVEEQDYLLGTVSESLEDTQALANVLHMSVDQVVEFYVYNTNSDVVRVVPLMPTWSWGGRGLLGAEVGTGYLHRLPHSTRKTGGSSIARKVRYKTASADNLSAMEHEPQLELESEETGGPVTLASPDDVSDMSSRARVVRQGLNGNGLAVEGSTIKEPTGTATVAVVVASATEAVAPDELPAEKLPLERAFSPSKQATSAAELFAGPPPDDGIVMR